MEAAEGKKTSSPQQIRRRRDRSSSPPLAQSRNTRNEEEEEEEEEDDDDDNDDEEEESEEDEEEESPSPPTTNADAEEDLLYALAPLEFSLSFGRALNNFVRLSAAYWVEPQRTRLALERILQQDKPTILGPSRRVFFFLFFGFFLSMCALYLMEDEYYTGPKMNTSEEFYPVHISFENLSCFINGAPAGGNNGGDGWIISNITGDARPGRLMGILGSSGSGKTTLAQALLGRNRRACAQSLGTVRLNGIPGSLDSFLDRVGFVPQDDVLYPEQTVRETITFAANARLPRYFTREQIDQQVNDTLRTLDLEHVQHSLVGGAHAFKSLSGGERKRVSIGMELVTLPSVLVLDEPTSGLDGYQSHKLIGTLKLIASQYNVSVVAVVHQPSGRSFQLFDDLLLLQRGRMVYFGERADAITYFSSLHSLHSYFEKHAATNEDGGALNDAEILLDVTTGFTRLNDTDTDFLRSGFFQRQRELLRERALQSSSRRLLPSASSSSYSSLRERCGTYKSEFLRSMCHLVSGLQSALLHGQTGESLAYAKRPKPGIVFQSYQWWVLLTKLAVRRGLVLEMTSILSLAFTCAFLRHFNRTWQRKHIANFYVSVSIGMIAMMGAALEDDILPVRRAVSAGMLLGAHEFALVVFSLVKGFFTTHLFAIAYFAWRYAFDAPPSSQSRERVFVSSPFCVSTYIRFQNLVMINYFCARGYGLLINVLVDHSEKKSLVCCCATLIACHAFSLFTPQSSQLEKDGVYIFGRNYARFVVFVSSLSYVRYFLEAMFLWDPADRGDNVGREFTMRFYSYRDGTEAACANTIVAFTVVSQVVRFIVFAFRNANDYASYHDGPAFIIFVARILGVYFVLLVVALAYHHLDEILAAWTVAATTARRTTIENRRWSVTTTTTADVQKTAAA